MLYTTHMCNCLKMYWHSVAPVKLCTVNSVSWLQGTTVHKMKPQTWTLNLAIRKATHMGRTHTLHIQWPLGATGTQTTGQRYSHTVFTSDPK